MSVLPTGWVEVELGEVIKPKQTRNPRTDGSKSFRYIDVQAVDNDCNRVGIVKELTSRHAPSRARQLVKKDDVLFCLVRPYLRNIMRVPPEFDGEVASTAFCVLRPSDSVASHFLFYQVLRDSFISEVPTYGTSPPSAREYEFLKQRILLPPLPEQHRIVAKIKPMFARLDEGIAALKRTMSNLKRYRYPILKAAIEGRLTEQWRRENPPEKTGEELLRRILDERRKRWEEEQLARFKAKERKPQKDWKARYKEPVAPDTEKLPMLPEGWCWATVDQFASTACGGTPDRWNESYFGGGIPWVKSGELKDGPVLLSTETISNRGMASSSAKMFPAGTLCIALYGATVGKLGLLGMDATTNQAVCGILRPIAALPEYLYFALLATRPHLIRSGKGGAQSNISQQIVRSTPVALPPLLEQEAVITILNTQFPAVQQISERLLGSCLLTAPQLRQSILRCAFEGRLVPQNPDDEPASVLLKRIRSEREAE